MHVKEIKINDIAFNPFQCRTKKDRDELWKLEESIKAVGVKVPIAVYRNKAHKYGKRRYVLESGERRITASLGAGKTTIPAIIYDREPTDNELKINGLVENCLREDLRPIDKAKGLQSLLFTLPSIQNNHNIALLAIRRLGNINDRHGGLENFDEKKYDEHEEKGHKKPVDISFGEMKKVDEFLKMLGMSICAADTYLRFLELPEDVQDKIIYMRKKDDKKSLKRRGYITTVEANTLSRVKIPLATRKIYEQYIHSQMGIHKLEALVNKYVKEAKFEDPKTFARAGKHLSTSDYGIRKMAGENLSYAKKLDLFRGRSLLVVCSPELKQEYLWSLAELRASVVTLKQAVDRHTLKTCELVKEEEKERREIVEKDFSAIIQRGKHGRELSIPKSVMDALNTKAGDVVLLKIVGVNRREENARILARKDNEFHLTKIVPKTLWASINYTATWRNGSCVNGKWVFKKKEDADAFEEIVKRKLLLRTTINKNGSVEEYTGTSPRVSGSWRTKSKRSMRPETSDRQTRANLKRVMI